jgi:DNA-directed RNA polymerase specialized sigma24 family protein
MVMRAYPEEPVSEVRLRAAEALTPAEEAALAELEMLARIRLVRYEAQLAGRLLGVSGTMVLNHERRAMQKLRRMLQGRDFAPEREAWRRTR